MNTKNRTANWDADLPVLHKCCENALSGCQSGHCGLFIFPAVSEINHIWLILQIGLANVCGSVTLVCDFIAVFHYSYYISYMFYCHNTEHLILEQMYIDFGAVA